MPARDPDGMTAGYRAVIFDMDGVLVDSEPAFFEAVNLLLAEEDRRVAWGDYQQLLGTSVEVTWSSLIEMLNLRGALADYLGRYDGVLIDCLRQPRQPLPGAAGVLDDLFRRRVPYALATSSTQTWKEAVLESAGLHDRFDVAVTADMIEHAKPAPDIYLRAAELLAVEPGRCIAVEDTPPGISSAKAADMYAIQVRASSTAFPPIKEADLVIDTLESFPFHLLEA